MEKTFMECLGKPHVHVIHVACLNTIMSVQHVHVACLKFRTENFHGWAVYVYECVCLYIHINS